MATPTLIIGGLNITSYVSTMTVSKEVTYKSVITTRDGVEKPQNQFVRTLVDFSLLPSTPALISSLFTKLKGTAISVRYYDPYTNSLQTKVMRLASDLQELFLINAVDGNMYYSGKTIQLRQNGVG